MCHQDTTSMRIASKKLIFVDLLQSLIPAFTGDLVCHTIPCCIIPCYATPYYAKCNVLPCYAHVAMLCSAVLLYVTLSCAMNTCLSLLVLNKLCEMPL